MGLNLDYQDGQTPIDEDEKEGLLIKTISTKKELDEFEQLNIENALEWVLSKNFKPGVVFSEAFICGLHKRMYGTVWSWAGQFRKTTKNLGIASYQISVELKVLCDDALFWLQNHTYPEDEIAIRFKHRLVSIHCFSNGNGRHSRLMADIIIGKLFKKPMFSWGADSGQHNIRSSYLKAIKLADTNDYKPLLSFSRS
ncbi:MAG: cell filamentation protein Fic [Leeuwenhoekiella sp.]|nr:MAG: cell filamentation protein Fic [Leeuwenhoekiella sp.]